MRRVLTVRLRFIMFPRVTERTEYFITVYDTFRICFRTAQKKLYLWRFTASLFARSFHISIIYMVYHLTAMYL